MAQWKSEANTMPDRTSSHRSSGITSSTTNIKVGAIAVTIARNDGWRSDAGRLRSSNACRYIGAHEVTGDMNPVHCQYFAIFPRRTSECMRVLDADAMTDSVCTKLSMNSIILETPPTHQGTSEALRPSPHGAITCAGDDAFWQSLPHLRPKGMSLLRRQWHFAMVTTCARRRRSSGILRGPFMKGMILLANIIYCGNYCVQRGTESPVFS